MKKNKFLDFVLVYFNMIATLVINAFVGCAWYFIINSNLEGGPGLGMIYMVLLFLTLLFLACFLLASRLLHFAYTGKEKTRLESIFLFGINVIPLIIIIAIS
jgi:hypothetical protein